MPLGITHHNLDHRHSDRGLQWRPKSKRLRSIQHQDLTLHHLLHQGHVFVAAAAAAAAGILGQDRIRLEDHIHRHIHRHIPPGDHIRLRSQDQDHNPEVGNLAGDILEDHHIHQRILPEQVFRSHLAQGTDSSSRMRSCLAIYQGTLWASADLVLADLGFRIRG